MNILNKLKEGVTLSDNEIKWLLENDSSVILETLSNLAFSICQKYYGNSIYIRGLIEYSNYCKEDCYYCGIRKSNRNIKRFRLSKEEVLSAADYGYQLGFRTFVLQGGEDAALGDDYFLEIISILKEKYPETRITLSIGKRSFSSLERLKEAGADRFLLRQEAANQNLFSKLHPENQKGQDRLEMLYNLKKLGFTTGSGFMIGAPYQSIDNIIEDIRFLQDLQPHMIGVGPFIPHKDTIFKGQVYGDLNLSLKIVALLRILFPKALIPATTALNTIDDRGRILGILSGANVVMPNISPDIAKENYNLYNNKATSGLEAGAYIKELDKEFRKIGKKIEIAVGDPIGGTK